MTSPEKLSLLTLKWPEMHLDGMFVILASLASFGRKEMQQIKETVCYVKRGFQAATNVRMETSATNVWKDSTHLLTKRLVFLLLSTVLLIHQTIDKILELQDVSLAKKDFILTKTNVNLAHQLIKIV